MLPNRSGSTGSYRYGFQGQERDDEIKGEGNSLNYKYRMHDPRIGRFFAVDPLMAKYPFYSPYQFSGNRVIDMIELEGLEPTIPEYQWANSSGYSFLGDYYGDGSTIQIVQGWYVQTYIDNEAEIKFRYFNPNRGENGKWIHFVPISPRSLTDDIDALGHHVTYAITDNSGIEAKTTISAGYGSSNKVRFLGFGVGEESTAKVKLFEFDGLASFQEMLNSNNVDVALLSGFSIDDVTVTFNTGANKGIYSYDFEAGMGMDSNNNFNANIGGSGSASLLKGNIGFDISYSTKDSQFSFDWNLGVGLEIFSSSTNIPFMERDGLQFYQDTNIELNFNISGFFKDLLNKPVENNNDNRKVIEY